MAKNLLSNSIRFLMLGVFCFVLSVAHTSAQSQGSTGTITGTVTDSTGAIIPNAAISLTSKSTNATQNTTSNEDGIYRFVLLQPGTYSVKATSGSFAPQTLAVDVQVGRTVDANFTLGTGNVSAEVTVTADGIQTTTSNFDSVQDNTAIQNLPINGRRFQDFATLTPGAQVSLESGGTRGQISLSGQRGINANINVDGVDFTQPFFGGIRGGERSNQSFSIPQESIREFQVITAGYSAEFGRSSGGIINAVTKSGTNNINGSAFYLLRPSKLARGNDFSNALADQRLNALGINATLAPTQHQWGGSIGGPISKDKLFYFGSYEQQRFRAPRQVLYGNLTSVATGTLNAGQLASYNFYRGLEVPYTQTNDAIAALGKIDWNVNNANRFNIRYSFSDNNALNAVSTGETSLDPTTTNSLSTNGTEKNRNHGVVSQFISNFSTNIVNEFKFQFAKETRPRIPNQIVANINTSIGVYGTRNFLPTTQYDTRWQFGDSLTFISGNHTMKFGGEYSHLFADQTFGFNQTGVYTFSGLTATTSILDAISTNQTASVRGRFDTTTARYNQQIGNLQAGFAVQELSFFAQDAWRVSPNLTLNYGLRFEKQYNQDAEANNTAVLNLVRSTSFPILGKTVDPAVIPDSQNEWGPRVGFAYDPKADGKTVIRGFAGMYYARTPLIVLAAPFNNFRVPAGDLSVTLGSVAFNSTGFNQATFDAQNPNYVAIMGGTGFTPNTVFRQFAILGINLNNSSLSNLPTLTTTQLTSITNSILAATTNPAANLGVFQGANFIGMTSDFKNPQSLQFGGGVEHELWKGVVGGIDYSQVATSYLQRNRDINLPAPTGVDATSGRVLVNRASRPLTSIGTIQLRDSSAHSLYKSLTFRINVNKKLMKLNAFYILSRSTSDDDNERDSGGVLYDNPYKLTNEYYNSNLDRRHQFTANPIFFLKYGFEVSSAIRLRSGRPVNSLVGSDLNGDGNSNERPMIVPGVELVRNYYTNLPIFDVDMRVQKGFNFGETRRVLLSAEFFNILNRSNLQFSGSATTNFCASASATCGLNGIGNSNFLNTIQQLPTAANFGKLNIGGLNPGSQVFQMQLGARFYF
ncbi:MAG TPA: TonB-dependent receptor [Pyrinomonadaceae bacterium]|nr:TonB-dependent receptor [Pyrinomonadaceae bacterium]